MRGLVRGFALPKRARGGGLLWDWEKWAALVVSQEKPAWGDGGGSLSACLLLTKKRGGRLPSVGKNEEPRGFLEIVGIETTVWVFVLVKGS